MKIVVAGAGFVGLSFALLLAQHHEVVVVDISESKVTAITEERNAVLDESIAQVVASKGYLGIHATLPGTSVYKDADVVVVATPTNYDEVSRAFDTRPVVEVVSEAFRQNPNCAVVIKSTVPIGFTENLSRQYPGKLIMFSPEFLREGKAYTDNLNPTRIIVGLPQSVAKNERCRQFGQIFMNMILECLDSPAPTLSMHSTEAEAVKLFANSYLALRVSFFNELDTYSRVRGLETSSIIDGVCLDPRIGQHYNNPSFGYGGYCLPKDTKQLLANYENIPQRLIEAIVESNCTRIAFIADEIITRVLGLVYKGLQSPTVGVYRLSMKAGSSNSRASSVLGVISRLCERGIRVQVYEPNMAVDEEGSFTLVESFEEFLATSDIVVANRRDDRLIEYDGEVYSCDLTGQD